MNVSQIEIALSPALYEWRTIKQHHTTVPVDILRATTAICAAFQSGIEEIVPLDNLEDLERFRQQGYLRAAERGGLKVGDAECGNSPTEYLAMHNLRGRKLAYSTTNGTVTVLRARDAERTLVGCFANISVLAQRLIQQPQDLVILCSGWKNDFSLEDTLFAGALCERLLASGMYATQHDAVMMAVDMWHLCQGDPYAYCLTKASHVQRLISFGAQDDIRFCFREDTCPLVPQLFSDRKDSYLRII